MFTRTHHDDLLAKRGIIATRVLGITGPDVLNAVKGVHPRDMARRARDMAEGRDTETPDLATLITRSLSTSVLDAKTLEILRRNKGRMADHHSIDTVYDKDDNNGHDDDAAALRYRFAQTLKSCPLHRKKRSLAGLNARLFGTGFSPSGDLYSNPGTYALKPHFTDSANGIVMAPERAAPERRTSFAQISDMARAADTVSADTVDDRHGTMFGVTRALDRKRVQDGHAPRTFEEGATGVLNSNNDGSTLNAQFAAVQADPRVAARDAQAILDMTEPAVRSSAPAPKPAPPVFIFAPAPGVH